MMARRGWYEALVDALKKEDDAGAFTLMQLATLDPSTNIPRVRSLIQRDFITVYALPALPLILSTTDIRTPKVPQLTTQPRVEVVFWTPTTMEQFRVVGRVSVVPAPRYAGAYPPRVGIVYDALERGGFDWEAKRVTSFDAMSGRMKASWCRPVPGTPLKSEDEMKEWPETLPNVGKGESDEERRNLEMALGNFALVVVEPFEVDYVELGVQPDRRRVFRRDWEDERGEFRETLVVP
ncbi:pyridoxamine 5'-phosphate oxidase-domain-containing protein [Chiua virens]|nr:pyridoxamine 5'-phosphate oxidase-domain-containing protein [Chiua virens]